MIKIETNLFNLEKTLECGQFFRYKKLENNNYLVFSKNKVIECYQIGNILHIENSDDEEYWKNFFDIDGKYNEMNDDIIKHHPFMKEYVEKGYGIHILRQEPVEVIISFIISQNKQIPQIQQCVELLCEKYGEKIKYKNKIYYGFPSLEKLSTLSYDDFRECKVGFRDKYIFDAIKNINKYGIENIKYHLRNIQGIGPKVEACILLFAYQDYSVFPIDTWIRKTMQKLFFKDNEKIDDKKIIEKAASFGIYKGIAQQYLFFSRKKFK